MLPSRRSVCKFESVTSKSLETDGSLGSADDDNVGVFVLPEKNNTPSNKTTASITPPVTILFFLRKSIEDINEASTSVCRQSTH